MEMAINQALQTYRATQINSASPEALVLMLYRGATKQVRAALQALEREQLQEAHSGLLKAQDIVIELRMSLNPQAGDMSHKLGALYEYVHNCLLLANVKKSGAPAEEALGILEGLTEAWLELTRGRLWS